MSRNDERSPNISRRDFSRRTAIAAATVAALPSAVRAAAETPKSAATDQPEIDRKIQAIFGRYGERLSETQKSDVRRLVREGQKPLDAMRKFPLGNANQPGNVLRLYPDAPAAHED